MTKTDIRVLIIDDDEGDVRLMTTYLNRARRVSFIIDTASDAKTALEKLVLNVYDICLLDYFLGADVGLDVLRAAKAKAIDIPFVVITGADSEETDEEVMLAGAADFLPKEEAASSQLLERTLIHAIEREKHVLELQRLATQDPLTKLFNRASFEDSIERTISISRRRNSTFGILLLDLDRFKEINDTLGHDVGDSLLCLVASRLMHVTRKEDIIARVGGDEFTILINNVESYQQIESVADKALHAIAQPFPLNNNSLTVSTSIGIAVFPDSGQTSVELMKHADLALYKAKALGKNNFQFFSRELQRALQTEINIEKGLLDALHKDQLRLHFQSKHDLETMKISGFEALVRWEHPKDGLIPPDKFIPVAEKTGLIEQLGNWVLDTACRQLSEWRQAGFDKLCMAVNVSPKQLANPDFPDRLTEKLTQYNLPRGSIEMEITEAMLVDTSRENVKVLENIHKQAGANISIDDFGTGYSSLKYIKDFPIDRLKIDRCFISGPETDLRSERIVSAIAMLAGGLDIAVTAEGIETEEQLTMVRKLGCDEGQGYYLGRPVDAEAARARLEQEALAAESEQNTADKSEQ